MVTSNDLANFRDEVLSTPSNPNQVDQQDLAGDGSNDGAATFADDGSEQDAAFNEAPERATMLTEQGFTLVAPEEATPLEAPRGAILTAGLETDEGAAFDQLQARLRGDDWVEDVAVPANSEVSEHGRLS